MTMTKLKVLATVIAAASMFIDKADSFPNVDIQNLLQTLQQQIQQEQARPQPSKWNVVDDNESESHYGSLKKEDLGKLFSQSSNKYKSNSYTNEKMRNQQNLEEYLLNRRPNSEDKLYPNNLLALNNNAYGDTQDRSSSEDQSKEDNNPGGYSKVYVVLNSDAVRKTKSKDKLNALLSSLLSSPPSREQRDRRYKGFYVNDDSVWRRFNRDSNEIYAKDPVMEKERPMRQREARGRGGRERGGGGGGGGSGGRTAIPYIRQRGDIYERDE